MARLRLPVKWHLRVRLMNDEQTIRERLRNARLVVVKAGSSVLADEQGAIRRERMEAIAAGILSMRKQGASAILVTSGAVAAGVGRLGLTGRPHAINEVQAAAAVGQTALIDAYEAAFRRFNVHAALVLLTHDDVESRERYLNARSTLRTLLELGVVPVVNENDTVATDELRFGDNDVLAGLVTNLMNADALVMLTDQPGLFERDPRTDRAAHIIRFEWAEAAPLTQLLTHSVPGRLGRGGIASKVAAARLAARSGANTLIADGRVAQPLEFVLSGKSNGTLIASRTTPLVARKRWIADQRNAKGELILDDGAVEAVLRGGKSLLPVGVLACGGAFGRGDLVLCMDASGNQVAKCLVNYSSEEARKILGKSSAQIESLLGYVAEPELAHRDNLVILGEPGNSTQS